MITMLVMNMTTYYDIGFDVGLNDDCVVDGYDKILLLYCEIL